MRKIIYLMVVIVIFGYLGFKLFKSNTADKSNKAVKIQTSRQKKNEITTPFQGNLKRSIFIPYWNIPKNNDDISEYDTLIYFGIIPDEDGKLNIESGMLNIESFIHNTSGNRERLLTVRMLDTENNLAILDDINHQSSVISETIDLVEEYDFDGIVLDLEMGVLPLGNVENKITSFVKDFADEVHDADRTFSMTIYGDVFYRMRPYDVEVLAQSVDQIYVMAYDFHKSRGEPGPNFPFDSRDDYGYDFQQMVGDFTSVVPRENITILFGMYGYDWTLGAQGKPLKVARAIPLKEIEEGIVPSCSLMQSGIQSSFDTIFAYVVTLKGPTTLFHKKISALADPVIATEHYSDCRIIEDGVSHEKKITYIDDEGYDHVLWYEDEESVEIKVDYLREQGIGSVGYWVWGYF